MKSLVCFLLLAFAWPSSLGWGQARYGAERDPQSPAEIPYTRYFTRDKFNRRVTFYLAGDAGQRLPLVVVVLGSGPFSNFRREGDKIVDAHGTVRRAFAGKAQVMAVEKPGVEFLDQPDHRSAVSFRGSPAFQAENALPRWMEAVSSAVRAARTLPQVDLRSTLVIGHSEGGLVAALVAQKNSFVTHVASLAGTGPPLQLELEHKASEARLYAEAQDTLPVNLLNDAARQMSKLKEDLAAIRRDPDSATKVAIGHTHIYWASRLKPSAMQILSRSKARIFLAHGTADRNVSFPNFTLMLEELRKRRRNVTEMVVEGGDHGFRVAATNGNPARDAWGEVIARIAAWFAPQDQ